MFVHATGAGAAATSTMTAGEIFETAPASSPSTLFTSATFPPATEAFARSGCRSTLAWERSAFNGNFAGAAAFAESESTTGDDPPFTVADADTAVVADAG